MARLTPHKTKLWEARDAALTVSFEDIYIYNHPIRGSSEIRLLTLIPSKSEVSELEAHLCVVSLQPTPPEYEALSYVWKEQPEYSPFADLEPWPLRLGTSRFMISRCLANILFHLRDRYQPRMLWIDAICIDQASAVEKNHQVRQMCNIYSMARRVIIWLGETVYKKEDIFAEKHRLRQEFLYGPPLRIKREFWSRTWWSRIWTLQEGLAASSDSVVYLGDQEVSWQDMLAAMHQSFDPETRALFLAQNLHLSPTLEYFGQIYSSRQESEEVTLEGLISASWERKASDPRDHIYALLGLVTPSSNKLFDADYSKSTSWAYQKAMLYITESRQNLDYLISAAKQGLPREPSWCVDFSRKKQLTYIESSWFQRRYGTNEGGAATGRETCQLLHDIDQSTLTLKGTIVGTVKLITLFAPPTTSKYCGPAAVNALIDKISSLKQLIYDSWASRLGQRIATSKVYAGDIWKLAANGQPGEVLFDEFSDIKDPYTLVAELGDMDAEDVLDGKYTCSDDHFNDIWKVITAITQGSSGLGAFVTGTGYAGSGYVSLQEGDVVVVIFGCRMPLVLRPMDGGMYALVDAVYVDGIMRGEILADEATYIETEFVLR